MECFPEGTHCAPLTLRSLPPYPRRPRDPLPARPSQNKPRSGSYMDLILRRGSALTTLEVELEFPESAIPTNSPPRRRSEQRSLRQYSTPLYAPQLYIAPLR